MLHERKPEYFELNFSHDPPPREFHEGVAASPQIARTIAGYQAIGVR
jgi:hypothetical protein